MFALVPKIAAPFVAIDVVAAYTVPDINVILNLLGLLAIVWFGPRYLKVRDLQAQIAAKDQAIETNEQSIVALDRRVEVLEEELRGAQERGNLAEERAHRAEKLEHEWKARYDEQARYTAGPAFAELSEVISGLAIGADKRHDETIQLIRQLAGEHAVTHGQQGEQGRDGRDGQGRDGRDGRDLTR